MTTLPQSVSWESPAPGAFTRQLRFGEWISEPVTPLFESWLLTAMEERTHADYLRLLGQRVPRPYHVLVNGWYFYTLNWAAPGSFARNLPNMLWNLIRSPRTVAGINPSTVRYSFPIIEPDWRADLQPRYRAAVERAEGRVETLEVAELPALIDDLADLAGESFTSVTALAGAAYKMEANLARFYRRYLSPSLGGGHLPLLTGFEPPTDPPRHAVASLDWWFEPRPERGGARLGYRPRVRDPGGGRLRRRDIPAPNRDARHGRREHRQRRARVGRKRHAWARYPCRRLARSSGRLSAGQ